MEYPDNFETPVNPAGKSIAVSRLMGILIFVCFLLIAFLCTILIWSSKSESMEPFIISANNDTEKWEVIGQKSDSLEYSRSRSLQESVAIKFISDWFSISDDNLKNNLVWKKCDRTTCLDNSSVAYDYECGLYCATDEALFTRFSNDVLPDYQMRIKSFETRYILQSEISLKPIGTIQEFGGVWHTIVRLYSNSSDAIDIEVFIKINQNKNNYPKTLGFYVSDFNSYRIN